MNKVEFHKVNPNHYISNDEKFLVVNMGTDIWVVMVRNTYDCFYTVLTRHALNSASEAMAKLQNILEKVSA